MNSIQIFEDDFDSLSAHLPYRHFLAPGVLLLDDDDAMLALIEFSGRDQSVLSEEDLHATSIRTANLLKPFDVGNICLHFEVQKRRMKSYPKGRNNNPVSSLIDAKRRDRMSRDGAQYVFRTYLGVTYTPPKIVARKLHNFFFTSPEEQTGNYYEEHVVPFREMAETLARHMSTTLGHARLLNDDEIVTAIYNQIDPEGKELVAAPPLPGFAIKHLFQTVGAVGEDLPYRTNGDADEEWHVKVFGVGGYPAVSDPAMLRIIQEVDTEFRLSFRFECLDAERAAAVLKWLWRMHDETAFDWRALVERIGGISELRKDPVGMMEAMNAEAARKEAAEPGTMTGFLTVTGIVWGRTQREMKEAYKKVQDAFHPFTLRGEGWNSSLAWLGTLVGSIRPNARRVPLPNTVLSDFVLLTSPWPGTGPNKHHGYEAMMRLDSLGGNGVNVDFFRHDNGGGALFGPMRGGKSTALAFTGHQWLERPSKPRVVWIDVDSKKSTSMVATWMSKGEFISFTGEQMALQPLARIDTEDGLTFGKRLCMAIFDRKFTYDSDLPRDRVEVLTEKALQALRAAPVKERTLTGFANVLQNERMRSVLRNSYCKGASLGHLMDADYDRIQDADWITVDLGTLLESGETRDIEPAIIALFRRFFDLFQDGRPTLCFVDEFRQLGAVYEELSAIRRRGPKMNVGLVISTHRLEDFIDTPIWPVLKTLHSRFFFGDTSAPTSDVLSQFDVTMTERLRIAEAGQRGDKGWTLFKNEFGSRVVKFELTDLELAVCGCGPDDRDAAIELYERVGRDRFPIEWLRHKNLHLDAAELERRMTGRFVQAAE